MTDLIDKARNVRWIPKRLGENLESVRIWEHFLKLGLEHIPLDHNLSQQLIGNPLQPIRILNLFRERFLIPLLIFLKPANNCRESFLLIMQVLPKISYSYLILCNSLCHKYLIFHT